MKAHKSYTVRVQIIKYEYNERGDCTGESVVDCAEGVLWANILEAHIMFKRAKEAAEAK